MKFNDKDIILCFFILIFLAEGISYFRLNKLEKITDELTQATSGLYEIYKLDRQLDALDDIRDQRGSSIEGLGPVYPLPKKPLD